MFVKEFYPLCVCTESFDMLGCQPVALTAIGWPPNYAVNALNFTSCRNFRNPKLLKTVWPTGCQNEKNASFL